MKPKIKSISFVIPAYQESAAIAKVIRELRLECSRVGYKFEILLVDDGSSDNTAQKAGLAGAKVIGHAYNRGYGASLKTGIIQASNEIIIIMDADGQHFPGDIPRFIETFRRTGVSALVGNRMADQGGMPLVRKLTNIFMSWYLSRQMGQHVPDTQCGYRLYAAQILPYLATESSRYAAESETLLRAAAQNIKIGSVPIKVIYRDEKSKIRPFRDTIRFFAMVRRFKKEIKAEQNSRKR